MTDRLVSIHCFLNYFILNDYVLKFLSVASFLRSKKQADWAWLLMCCTNFMRIFYVFFLLLLMPLAQLQMGSYWKCATCLAVRCGHLLYFIGLFPRQLGLAAHPLCALCGESFTSQEVLVSTNCEEGCAKTSPYK